MDRQRIGQGEGVGHVWRLEAALLHVLLPLELDLVADVVAVLDPGQVGDQILVVGQADAVGDGLLEVGPHLGAHVDEAALRGLGTEVDLDHVEAQLPQPIDDRAAHPAAVDEDRVGPLLVGEARDLADELHGVHLLVDVMARRRCVPTLPHPDHAAVVAEPGDVDAHDQRIVRCDVHLSLDAGLDRVDRDELQAACAGELALDADLEEVAVLAVVGCPLLEQALVRLLDVAAVDEAADVPIAEPAHHVLVEATAVPRRVAEVERHRLAVGQAALAHLEDLVGDRRRLVEDVEGRGVGGVQTGEGFAVLFPARDPIDPPRLAVLVVVHVERAAAAVQRVPVARQPHAVPLGQLGPRLGAELLAGVGGDHALRERAGVHDPADQPRHDRRLADAVARCGRELDRRDGQRAVEAARPDLSTQLLEEVLLPLLRPLAPLQLAAAPRVADQHMPQRICVAGGHLLGDLLVRLR